MHPWLLHGCFDEDRPYRGCVGSTAPRNSFGGANAPRGQLECYNPSREVIMSKKWPVRMLLMSIGIALFFGSTVELAAWEEDVHYVLTFWPATRAGFSRNDADQIAKADQSYDD